MKGKWMAALLAGALELSAVAPVGAADQWDMAYIGRMKLPKGVTFTEGEQQALPFLATGGIRWTLIRAGMLNGTFYNMTWADGADFSYGWAASVQIGAQYLAKEGAAAYRNKTPAEQMDVIAANLNGELRASGITYEGDAPLVRRTDRGHPSWEGSFVVTVKENDITYREAYHMVLQVSGFRVVLGIINSDADNTALTESLSQMVEKRRFYKEKDLLEAFLRRH